MEFIIEYPVQSSQCWRGGGRWATVRLGLHEHGVFSYVVRPFLCQ